MKRVDALQRDDVAALTGVVFDLDGTLLTGSQLTLTAYRALHELADAGLRLVVCTGRPAAWGEVVQRQWPVALTITENGAIGFRSDGPGVVRIDRADTAERARRRSRLTELAAAVQEAFPALQRADDNAGRVSDVTFDIGERHRVDPPEVARIRSFVAARGGRTFVSSIHLHVTFDTDDKASGTVHMLGSVHGDDASAILHRYAFIGDSGNDEACFSAFHLTFGVANLRTHLGLLSVTPCFISAASSGEGFAEIAAKLLSLGVPVSKP